MDKTRKIRQRGVVLTSQGYQKLQVARQQAELANNGGDRYTLEDLSERTGLSLKTITKVLDRRSTVDKPTLEAFFQSFQLLLERQDYRYPSDPSSPPVDTTPVGALPAPPTPQIDWGEAPDVSLFYGRQAELAQLQQWIAPSQGQPRRLIAILGMGGMGKTTLATKLVHEVLRQSPEQPVDYVIWRSLRNAPPLEVILSEWLSILSNYQDTQPSLSKLLPYLQTSRCLLVLDNWETILSGISGTYRQGYEAYGDLLNLVGETGHRSSLIITSREKTLELNTLAGESLPVCCLALKGSGETSVSLLQAKGLRGTVDQQHQLCDRYGNSPLAIKIIAATIQDLFDGDMGAFLQEDATIFPGIRRLLDQQFDRLSSLEQAIMYWLAINRDWTGLEDLSTDLLPTTPRSKILAAIEQLHWRNLIEKRQGLYTQQPLVMEYVTERLTERISAELLAIRESPPVLLHRYAILKTTVKDYIRDSQRRLIVAAIARELQASLGSETAIAQHLKLCLALLRPTIPTNPADFTPAPSYAAGNLLNLLCTLKVDLTGLDCSGLAVWHAYLPNIPLPQTNFAYTDLRRSRLTDTFGAVFSVAFSPDGTQFATGELSGFLRLWRVKDGDSIWSVRGCYSWIRSVAFSPDGTIVAMGAGDHTIELWDAATGRPIRSLTGHQDQIHCIAFDPTGERLISACGDHTLRLWDVQQGTCLHCFVGHTDQVQSVCFSPDGRFLVSSSSDRTLKIWEVATQTLRQTLTGHQDHVFCVSLHPSGTLLASGSGDGQIYLWQVESGQLLRQIQGHKSPVLSVQFSPEGDRLVSSGGDCTIRLWDSQTGQALNTLTGHHNWVRAVQFSPDGRTLLSGGSDYRIKLWDLQTGQALRTWLGYSNWIWSAEFSQDGRQLVSGGGDRTVRVWDVATGQCVRSMRGHTNWILGVAWDPNSNRVASASSDNSVILWQAETGQAIKTLTGHESQVIGVQFSPTEQILASSSSDYSIRLWDVGSGHPLRVLQGHQDWIRAIAFRRDGQVLASAGQDAVVKLWDVHTGTCLQTLPDFKTWVWGVCFHPDGDQLLTASGGTLKLWDLQTGSCLKTYQDDIPWIRSIAISPDGRELAAGGQDQLVRLWDLSSGSVRQTFAGHTDQVLSVRFSPDSRYLVSGSADETLKVWDRVTGGLCRTLQAAGLYDGMTITGARGLSQEALTTLVRLGAKPNTLNPKI